MRIGIGALTLLALACGSGARSGPTFAYGPVNAPLRYDAGSYQSIAVETPMGNQESHDTLEATVALTVGATTAGGRSVTAVFESLNARTSGAMGATTVSGGDLIGQQLTGTLTPTGRIDIAARPQLPANLAERFDPLAFFADLLAPMPADGNTAAPWPVRIEATSETAMRITGIYEGTARLAGDTTWNGHPASIIVSEGTTEIRGKGTPSGAPAELEMKMTGTSTRRYVWDPARGVLLAGWTHDTASGSIDIASMGLTLTAKTEWRQRIDLKP